MDQSGISPSIPALKRPIPRRKRKDRLFTLPVLVLMSAVFLTLIGILLVVSSAAGFFYQNNPPPGIITVTPPPLITISPMGTIDFLPCSSIGKVCDADDPHGFFQPFCIETDLGDTTYIYYDNISYPHYSFSGKTSLKAVNLYPVTELVVDYRVPDVTVKKILVDKEIIEYGFLIGRTYKTVYVTYPDPDALCEIKVYDDSGYLVAAEGFGGQYDSGKRDVITYLRQGNYTIEMTGKRIEFTVYIIEK
ncbi:MAG TPA: hypothetical protein VJ857_04435 [Methanocorpusculum sp.]|nr:hypothetical protein [Methanocorpusculum sp.]